VTPRPNLIVELFGEGKTDIGKAEAIATPPDGGVLPRLVHALCQYPPNMLVKRRTIAFLQGKGWVQKVKFAKRQAPYNGSAGVVIVLDSEGQQAQRMQELTEGRGDELSGCPLAVGAPHPCIEVWLLADPAAITKGMGLSKRPQVPEDLESLPAPCHDRKHNPKTILVACCGLQKSELTTTEKDRIAANIRSLAVQRYACHNLQSVKGLCR
jgi:hypothetical protein